MVILFCNHVYSNPIRPSSDRSLITRRCLWVEVREPIHYITRRESKRKDPIKQTKDGNCLGEGYIRGLCEDRYTGQIL